MGKIKMNCSVCLLVCFIFLLLFSYSNSFAEGIVTKEVCLSAFGMNWKTSEEAKAYITTLVKRDAVGELFGEFIKSVTEVENFQLKKDDIVAFSSGFIRTKGIPEFYNGKGFGELCIKISAYVTDEDTTRFKPRSVKKKVCIADPRLSLGEIRQTAEWQSRIQAIRDFEPKLEKVKDDIVLSLIHESRTEAGGFIPETTTYCTTASGTVYPIELMAIIAIDNSQDAIEHSTKKPELINQRLRQDDKWKAEIIIQCLEPGNVCGRINFRDLKCGGDLIYIENRDNGYLFNEDLDYGSCVKGCQIWLDYNGTGYKEICNGRTSGFGNLFKIK